VKSRLSVALVAAGIACGSPVTAVQAQTLTTLYAFAPNTTSDGAYPAAPLIFDAQGALYGTTLGGGSGAAGGIMGGGTVFKLTPASGGAWTETILYRFPSASGGGFFSYAGLVSDGTGALYGTTSYAGNFSGGGYGTVFKLTPASGGSWTETVLYHFHGGSDGANPMAGLIIDPSGALYGTTSGGGVNNQGGAFKLMPPSAFSPLYVFLTGDGGNPHAGLTFDSAGTLYGVAPTGGQDGAGTVFKLTPPSDNACLTSCGATYTAQVNTCIATSDPSLCGSDIACQATTEHEQNSCISTENTNFNACASACASSADLLYSFTGGNDGGAPMGSLLFDGQGAFYGTTSVGGLYGQGTVFRLSPPDVAGTPWVLSVLYSFKGGDTDGAKPVGELISDSSGALYGVTTSGGAANLGTIFKLAPVTGEAWTETVLHSFTGGSDGATPSAGLVADPSDALYGTTSAGGANGGGTVFKLTTGVTFVGVPGQANCAGQSFVTLSKKYGGMAAAAKALGYQNVQTLQTALTSHCGG
jgi:uncharacterized repeat protein (TIGR03803 family)